MMPTPETRIRLGNALAIALAVHSIMNSAFHGVLIWQS